VYAALFAIRSSVIKVVLPQNALPCVNMADSCGCTEYANRQTLVPTCVKLTKETLKDIFFMPQSCSYRRLHEGRGLASWHPLNNNGSKEPMHALGISTQGKTVKDCDVALDDFDLYEAQWPTMDCD